MFCDAFHPSVHVLHKFIHDLIPLHFHTSPVDLGGIFSDFVVLLKVEDMFPKEK